MVKDRLKDLKTKADISCAEWSNLSTVPEATIRKILSGETPDPRFDTIVKLVTCLGGSIDDIVGMKKGVEIESNAVMVLKEAYESRIEALRERLDDYKERLVATNRVMRVLAVSLAVLVGIIVGMFIFDIALGTHGWVQH